MWSPLNELKKNSTFYKPNTTSKYQKNWKKVKSEVWKDKVSLQSIWFSITIYKFYVHRNGEWPCLFTRHIVLLSAEIKVRMGLLRAILDYLRPFLRDLWIIFQTISSLKLECEKLASEKIEIQRHYVMVSWSTKTLPVLQKILSKLLSNPNS